MEHSLLRKSRDSLSCWGIWTSMGNLLLNHTPRPPKALELLLLWMDFSHLNLEENLGLGFWIFMLWMILSFYRRYGAWKCKFLFYNFYMPYDFQFFKKSWWEVFFFSFLFFKMFVTSSGCLLDADVLCRMGPDWTGWFIYSDHLNPLGLAMISYIGKKQQKPEIREPC